MRIKLAWIAFGLALPQLACSTERKTDYFPLSVGSRWEYDFEVVVPGIGAQEGKALTRVESQETIGGKDYFKVVTSYSGFQGMTDEAILYRKDATGVYEKAVTPEEDPERLHIPLPLRVGDAWTVEGPNGKTDYQIESSEAVDTFARRFENCLKISYDFYEGPEHSEGHYFLAPGVGVVKRVLKVSNASLQMTLERYEP